MPFVSRAGSKLDHALNHFNLDITQKTCADLGCSTGGFTDCLLQRAAAKVYAVDTGYGVLDYKLRKDPRVIVMERTNAMHVALPEPIDIVTIDVAWTKQKFILPAARKILSPIGTIVSLIKPHYEVDKSFLHKGILPEELVDDVVKTVENEVAGLGMLWLGSVRSPIKGTGGNVEVLALLKVRPSGSD